MYYPLAHDSTTVDGEPMDVDVDDTRLFLALHTAATSAADLQERGSTTAPPGSKVFLGFEEAP